MYKGELISLFVAVSWTLTALFSEIASKRMGSVVLNVVRMFLSLTFLAVSLWIVTGVPYPMYTNSDTWIWLSLSGFVGYVLGDYCLFFCYIIIGSRYGQLLMTLAPPTAAVMALLLLGEQMSTLAVLGMFITVFGIGMSILGRSRRDDYITNLDTRQVVMNPLDNRFVANEESQRHAFLSSHGVSSVSKFLSSHRLHFSGFGLKLPLKGVLLGVGAGMGQGIGLVLSKVGMQHYENSITSLGMDMEQVIDVQAIFPLPLSFVMPFASTMIRAIIGLVGFSLALFFFSSDGRVRLVQGIADRRAMMFAALATVFGPFIGVSFSLMATLYTSTGIAQTIMALTPIFIIWPSYFFLHQKVTLREVIGAVISVAGVCLFFV